MFEKYMLKCCNAKHKARGWHRNCEQSKLMTMIMLSTNDTSSAMLNLNKNCK